MLQSLSGSALASLVKGLPEALQRQYEYEDPIVRSGKHLMHSPFFKVSILSTHGYFDCRDHYNVGTLDPENTKCCI